MSYLTVIIQARKDLYFRAKGKPRVLFMREGELRIMMAARAGMIGYKTIEFTPNNVRFFVPLDTCMPQVKT
jgi:hypothetical protein